MKIATSPFVYWGVAFFMPEKVGNLQGKREEGGGKREEGRRGLIWRRGFQPRCDYKWAVLYAAGSRVSMRSPLSRWHDAAGSRVSMRSPLGRRYNAAGSRVSKGAKPRSGNAPVAERSGCPTSKARSLEKQGQGRAGAAEGADMAAVTRSIVSFTAGESGRSSRARLA